MHVDDFTRKALAPLEPILGSVQELDDKQRQAHYCVAYAYYETGRWAEAAGVFTQLIFNNPFEVSYWKGLGSARQMDKQYEAALHAWAIVCLLNESDWTAHFHAAECLTSLGQFTEALKAIGLVQKIASVENPFQAKIHVLKEHLENATR